MMWQTNPQLLPEDGLLTKGKAKYYIRRAEQIFISTREKHSQTVYTITDKYLLTTISYNFSYSYYIVYHSLVNYSQICNN